MRILILVLFLLTAVGWAHPYTFQVTDYGANPGLADNSAPFQKALEAASKAGGGVVEVPNGRWRLLSPLTIPNHVSLVGCYKYSPSHAFDRGLPTRGSVLEVIAGKGQSEGAAITIQDNATLQGFSIYYPEQSPQAKSPTPYPWCVAMRGNNPALLDMELLNPYQGIDASKNQRAMIRNIHGQPLRIGLMVDEVYDVGRIENIHWNPWWSFQTPIYEWQRANGEGFLFGRTDWHSVLNTFCFGYATGYRFVESPKGVCNGSFVGIGADDCHTCVQVDQSAPFGLMITNGQFVAMHGPDPTHIRVGPQNRGQVRFVNCAFWGPARRVARLEGGTVGFGDCNFCDWDANEAALDVRAGGLMVRGCSFGGGGGHVRLGGSVERAIITENFVEGGRIRIEGGQSGRLVERDNLGR